MDMRGRESSSGERAAGSCWPVRIAGLSLLAGCAAAPSAAPALEDQLGGRWAIREVLSGPAFIIIGGPTESKRSTLWDNEVVGPLAERLGWSVHRVLRLSGYPSIFRSAVVSRVQASTRPPGTPIILDWEDDVPRRLGCDPGDTTIVVLARGGKELGRVRGEPSPAGRGELERIVMSRGASGR